MINYEKIKIKEIADEVIDSEYKNLLENKWQFLILELDNEKFVLTKEKSIFKITDEETFVRDANNDIYYKTIIEAEKEIDKEDFKLFKEYLKRYSHYMTGHLYGDKYIFGSVAVRTRNGFITTIRGKENLDEYTQVYEVDHVNHLVKVGGKKATLNAPLLDYLFKNENVKVIVHINHYFGDNLKYYEYAFPGTIRDSIRDNKTSFNIKYHGVVYLFDDKGNML